MLLVLVLLCLLSSSFCQDTQKSPDWSALILSKDEKERASGRRAVITQYSETVVTLLKIVEGPVKEGEFYYSSATSRNIAIRLLGKLRAKSAVSHLMGWLVPKKGQALDTGEEMKYGHAGYALVEIGLPAVPPLLEKVKGQGVTTLGKECMKVITTIKGKDEVSFLIKALLEKEKDKKAKENIQAALKYLRTLK
jgi:hypothetical protein